MSMKQNTYTKGQAKQALIQHMKSQYRMNILGINFSKKEPVSKSDIIFSIDQESPTDGSNEAFAKLETHLENCPNREFIRNTWENNFHYCCIDFYDVGLIIPLVYVATGLSTLLKSVEFNTTPLKESIQRQIHESMELEDTNLTLHIKTKNQHFVLTGVTAYKIRSEVEKARQQSLISKHDDDDFTLYTKSIMSFPETSKLVNSVDCGIEVSILNQYGEILASYPIRNEDNILAKHVFSDWSEDNPSKITTVQLANIKLNKREGINHYNAVFYKHEKDPSVYYFKDFNNDLPYVMMGLMALEYELDHNYSEELSNFIHMCRRGEALMIVRECPDHFSIVNNVCVNFIKENI